MPIRPEQKALYPKEWATIRDERLKHAQYRCEYCGVPDHAVGYRDQAGTFRPLMGSGPCDAAGRGRSWPGYGRLPYAEALEFAKAQNDCQIGKQLCDADGNHWIVIVLTIAHLHDPHPANVDPKNLAALCQRCHNKLDAPMRIKNARQRRRAAMASGDLFA
ncbi:MAG: hypothetical protein H6974_11130 [Gammaproteobacteria bacterium]|nr:hypothetical protein [Gammaproteobacteria bacterium]